VELVDEVEAQLLSDDAGEVMTLFAHISSPEFKLCNLALQLVESAWEFRYETLRDRSETRLTRPGRMSLLREACMV